jgi:hypothetical protein
MTVSLTKKELQAVIDSADVKIAKLQNLSPVTIEEAQANKMELQKLEAARRDLAEKLESAPE